MRSKLTAKSGFLAACSVAPWCIHGLVLRSPSPRGCVASHLHKGSLGSTLHLWRDGGSMYRSRGRTTPTDCDDSMTRRQKKPRTLFVRHALVAGALVAGSVVCVASAPAWATGTLHLTAATGLVQKQIVTVTGSGFADRTYGYVLECNATSGQPTVLVGPPFDQSLPVGCSAPSLKHIVSTTATGMLSTNFQVRLSKKMGPPCGYSVVLGRCGRDDSAGQHPRKDAQNYPCPPTSAQRALGATCVLVFYDSAHEIASVPISF